jgi:hypothetical protein
MYQHLLAELRAVQARHGEQHQPPCTEEGLARLRRRAREEVGTTLPHDYIAFLRAQDGLNHNGLFIYASETVPVVGATDVMLQGIVEANLDWRDSFCAYLIFGEGNMDLYVRHLPTGDYQVIDRTPGNVIETHASFDRLIAAAIKAHL